MGVIGEWRQQLRAEVIEQFPDCSMEVTGPFPIPGQLDTGIIHLECYGIHPLSTSHRSATVLEVDMPEGWNR
tara:strand:- start:387 stop:602 length:216 start_codon:yes stop_codon:yes gene_type:complete